MLLGDPGSGKSTALKLAAISAARRAASDECAHIPVLLPITAYADALVKADRAGPQPIPDFICNYLRATKSAAEDAVQVVRDAIIGGRALILLDGLDEVTSSEDRSLLVARLEAFVRWQKETSNCLIVTSRVIGYADFPLAIDGIDHYILSDFDDEEIVQFVDKWSLVAERVARGAGSSSLTAEEAAGSLRRAVFDSAGVRQLASNPLLLTILVFIHRQGMELPRRRAELYELYVKTLINSWARVRNLDGRPITPMDESEVAKVLSPVAYWIHANLPAGYCRRDVFETQVALAYQRWKKIDVSDAEARARTFVESLCRASGLLSERGDGRLSFAHLTFEEYFAARYIVLEGQVDKRKCVELLASHVGEPAWREVTNLVVGYFGVVTSEEYSASLIVEQLAWGDWEGVSVEERLLWAAEAAVDCGESGLRPETWRRLSVEARRVATDGLAPSLRWRAGRSCAALGDTLLESYSQVPELVDVPRGVFDAGAPRSLIDEKLQEIARVDLDAESEWVREYWCVTTSSESIAPDVAVQAFRIGRFPVVNSQYAVYLDACPDVPVPSPGDNARAERFRWNEVDRKPPRGRENQPVVLVSWQEAVAYCEWLSVSTGRRFRLPTEFEWEFAARGAGLERTYPWGSNWSRDLANSAESGVEDLVAVGLYPAGESGLRVADCVGQVWEWSASAWGDDWRSPRERDGSLAASVPSDSPWMIVRGGSWDDVRSFATCYARGPNLISFRSHYVGFRVVEEI